DGVELALLVFAERRQAAQARDLAALHNAPALLHDPDDRGCAEVAVHVHTVEARDRRAAVHVAADDRALAVGAVVLDDRILRTGRSFTLDGKQAHTRVPLPVDTLAATGAEVDLFVRALADVADPHVAGDPFDRPPPRVPQSVAPDLTARAGLADERIVVGDR